MDFFKKRPFTSESLNFSRENSSVTFIIEVTAIPRSFTRGHFAQPISATADLQYSSVRPIRLRSALDNTDGAIPFSLTALRGI